MEAFPLAKRNVPRRKPALSQPETEKKPFQWKKALILFLSFLGFFTLYQIGVYLEWLYVLHAYAITSGVLALVYGIWNRGVFSMPKHEELPKDWSKQEKEAFLAGIADRKRRSSILLYFLIPMILSIVFDMIYLLVTLNLGVKL